MMPEALNKHTIDALILRARSVSGKQFELIDDRESGLRIRAGERSATWLLNTRLHNGKRSRIKLGVWPSMGISDARKAAQSKKLEVSEGIDPNEAKREVVRQAALAAAARRTVGDVLDEYQSAKLIQLRAGDGVRRALDGPSGVLRALADREITSIARTDVAEAVRKHALKAPIAANRGLAYARAFLNWCVSEGILEANPAVTIKKPSKERQRSRCHSLDELREIWEAAGTLGYPFGPLYRLLILIPMRREEIAAMPLSELDLGSDDAPGDAIWTLPAERTKRENALRVPLSAAARSIIKDTIADPARPEDCGFVFSMTGDTPVSGFTKAKRRLDAAILAARKKSAELSSGNVVPMPHWTIHDLRTTFSTQACDALEIDMAVADRILNHVATATTSKIMRIYNQSELFESRKQALAKWAGLIERIAAAPA
jgi:integrase